MNRRVIHSFFKNLDARLGAPSRVILTGAACGSLMGHIRPSLDIDFEIRLKSRRRIGAEELDRAAREAARACGVAVNYSTDISRWSMVDYLDYRKTAVPYRKFGKCEVRLIAPAYWTIGKMTRFLEPDVQDMIKIIRTKRIPAEQLLRLWNRALRSSDLSAEARLFRDHVRSFIRTHARSAWGRTTRPDELLTQFNRLIQKH